MPMQNNRKTFVIDTNVLLNDPNAIYSFGDSEVVIPSVVLEEIDSKKKLMDELGRNARYVSRQLDELRELGRLHEGVSLDNGGLLRVVIHNPESQVFAAFHDDKNDNAIIAVAKELSEINPDTILVSKDVLVRVKADIVSVKAEDYQHDKVADSEDDLYKGYSEVFVDDELINDFYKEKSIKAYTRHFKNYPENHLFILKSEIAENKTAIGRKVKNKIVPLYNYKGDNPVFGLKHKNVQQMMALELLLDKSVPIVTLSGKAGTGKTLLALAAGLAQTLDEQTYNRVLVARPVVPMGKDIGYLPGEKEEKLRPWMQPIYDNLEFIFDCKNEAQLEKTLQGYEDIIKVEALTYIRGRSIPNQYIIIDEAQNLTQHEVKTITTRLGEGSKIVLVGDPYQIDHPYLDMYSNGLTYVTERLKEEKEMGHVTLHRGERSNVAQLCADKL
jgi:PhoH-like ATPase